MANTEKRLDSNIHVLPVILSGGEGKRLWPLSRASYPKQYLSINENDQFTLIQSTYLRLKKIDNLLSPLIVCNEEQRFVVAEQMRQINVGSDFEISIRDLAEKISKIVGFSGEIIWDRTKPDGTPRKKLDNSCIKNIGWKPTTDLDVGIRKTIKTFVEEKSKFI